MISVDVPVPGPLDVVPIETVVALGVPLTVPEVVTPPGPDVVTPPGPDVVTPPGPDVVTPPGPEVLMPVDDPVVTIVVAVVGV